MALHGDLGEALADKGDYLVETCAKPARFHNYRANSDIDFQNAVAAPQRFMHHERLFQNRTFGEKQWKRHSSWKRYLPEPTKTTLLLAGLIGPISWVLFVSIGVAVYQHAVRMVPCFSYSTLITLRDTWPNADNLTLDFVFNTVSFALSLLLVFKTNSSYSRFVPPKV